MYKWTVAAPESVHAARWVGSRRPAPNLPEVFAAAAPRTGRRSSVITNRAANGRRAARLPGVRGAEGPRRERETASGTRSRPCGRLAAGPLALPRRRNALRPSIGEDEGPAPSIEPRGLDNEPRRHARFWPRLRRPRSRTPAVAAWAAATHRIALRRRHARGSSAVRGYRAAPAPHSARLARRLRQPGTARSLDVTGAHRAGSRGRCAVSSRRARAARGTQADLPRPSRRAAHQRASVLVTRKRGASLGGLGVTLLNPFT